MSGYNNKKLKVCFGIATILLMLSLAAIVVMAVIFIRKGNDEFSKENIAVADNDDGGKKGNVDNGVLETYNAVFEVTDDSNQTLIDNTVDILEKRMSLFGMAGEADYRDGCIYVSAGITDIEQKDYLEFIATPGDFSLTNADRGTMLKRNMIVEHRAYIDECLKDEASAGVLHIELAPQYTDKFKKDTEAVLGQDVLVIVDGNTIKFFKWEAVCDSATVNMSCFDYKWLTVLDVLLDTEMIKLPLIAR